MYNGNGFPAQQQQQQQNAQQQYYAAQSYAAQSSFGVGHGPVTAQQQQQQVFQQELCQSQPAFQSMQQPATIMNAPNYSGVQQPLQYQSMPNLSGAPAHSTPMGPAGGIQQHPVSMSQPSVHQQQFMRSESMQQSHQSMHYGGQQAYYEARTYLDPNDSLLIPFRSTTAAAICADASDADG
jgi:hypothetical protein